jgi:putative membrane protein
MTGDGYGEGRMSDHTVRTGSKSVLATPRSGPASVGPARHADTARPHADTARPHADAAPPYPDAAHPHPDRQPVAAGTNPGRHAVARRTSLLLVAAGVLAQIAYPLLSGDALRAATILSVLLLAAASIVHAAATWGRRGLLVVPLVAGGLGLAAETLGVHTGFPFGVYAYADTLGPRLASVPLVVPLAWTMLAYPSLLLGRRLARYLAGERWARSVIALTGGVALTGWDLFLDPQMVADGHWSWAHPKPALPGVPGVPLTNYAGWLLVAVLMIAVLNLLLPPNPKRKQLLIGRFGSEHGSGGPAVVLAWTWCGSTLGNLAFFDRPWVALYGGLVMGTVVGPYLALVLADRSAADRSAPDKAAPDEVALGVQKPPQERNSARRQLRIPRHPRTP